MLFIGRNHSGHIISIISAKTQESANAYWQGKGILPHSQDTWDFELDRENENQGFVTPILETEEIELCDPRINRYTDHKYIIVMK